MGKSGQNTVGLWCVCVCVCAFGLNQSQNGGAHGGELLIMLLQRAWAGPFAIDTHGPMVGRWGAPPVCLVSGSFDSGKQC